MTYNDWKFQQRKKYFNEYQLYHLFLFKLLKNKNSYIQYFVDNESHSYISIALVGEIK